MYESRWYQRDAERSIFNYFENVSSGNPVVVMPGGTGKSHVIGNFIKSVFSQWSNQKIMILTHVKELIVQNANKLLGVWPNAPVGIHSAGLKSRDTALPIIFGGIQSVTPTIKKAIKSSTAHFGYVDLIIIDECHLLSPDDETMYQFVIKELKLINPFLKVIGFTATHYRLKQGLITDGGLFTDICYDISDYKSYNRLIDEGFLSPLIVPTRNRDGSIMSSVDLSNVKLQGGDYNQKQLNKNTDDVLYNALKQSIEYGYNRRCWLAFGNSIETAENINSILQSFGINSEVVHSKLSSAVNDKRIKAYVNGDLQCMVNNNKLTTGFDNPMIDMIIDLGATTSTSKNVQKLSRAARPSPGKTNALILDYVRNIARLGPINDPVIPTKAGKGTGEAPIKVCDNCGYRMHTSVRVCEMCGMKFEFKTKIFSTVGTEQALKTDTPVIEYFNVKKVIYNLHEKVGKPPSIRVSYLCNLKRFDEWVMLEHGGFVAKKARDWWMQRHNEEPPLTTHEALKKVSQLRAPKQIRVQTNKKYPEILSTEWE